MKEKGQKLGKDEKNPKGKYQETGGKAHSLEKSRRDWQAFLPKFLDFDLKKKHPVFI
jgi:hypothetical protein